jgi:ketosteroid isomerase-like protein
MSTQEVAKRFYELAQQGAYDQIQNDLYHTDAESIEPQAANGLQSAKGIEQIREKGKKWNEMIEEMHGGYCNEPAVAGNHFTVTMGVEATMKGQGRVKMDEVAVYEVKDGKIVKEQFFY